MNYQDFKEKYTFSSDTLLSRGMYGMLYLASVSKSTKKYVVRSSKVKDSKKAFSLKQEYERAKAIHSHPNILHYDSHHRFAVNGVQTDFVVAPYYKEGNVWDFIHRYNVSYEDKVTIAKGIINGIGHLHKNKMPHCGLSSSNIVIENHIKLGLIPKICHFGLNHLIGKTRLLQNKHYNQNLEYAAPEQILEDDQITFATDYWTLGVILFELFTETKIFSSYSKDTETARKEIFKKILSTTVPQEELNKVPEPIRTVIWYCLQRNPSNRIQKSDELIEIIDHYSNKDFVTPSLRVDQINILREDIKHSLLLAPSPFKLTKDVIEYPQRLEKKRNKIVFRKKVSLYSMIGALVVGMGLGFWLTAPEASAVEEVAEVENEFDPNEVNEDFFEEGTDSTELYNNDAQPNSESSSAVSVAEATPSPSPAPAQTEPTEIVEVVPDDADVSDEPEIAFNPKDYRLAQTIDAHKKDVYKIKLIETETTTKLATAGWDETIRIWNLADNKQEGNINVGIERVFSMDVSPDGKTIATGSWENITLWDATTYKKITQLKGHIDDIEAIAFSPDGNFLASGSWDETIKIWDLEKNIIQKEIEIHSSDIEELSYTKEGDLVASASKDNSIKIWSPEENVVKSTMKVPSNFGEIKPEEEKKKVEKQVVSTESMEAIAGAEVDEKNKPEIIDFGATEDAYTKGLLEKAKDYKNKLNAMAFNADATLIAVSKGEGIQVWDTQTGKVVSTFLGHKGPVYALAFHPDEPYLASGGKDKTIKIWDLKNNVLAENLTGHKDVIWTLIFEAFGLRILSGSKDKTIKVWELRAGITAEEEKKKKEQEKKAEKVAPKKTNP